jgi:hypothetical protein
VSSQYRVVWCRIAEEKNAQAIHHGHSMNDSSSSIIVHVPVGHPEAEPERQADLDRRVQELGWKHAVAMRVVGQLAEDFSEARDGRS